MDLMHHFLAGIWPLLLKYTFAVGGIGAALALAWFFPPFRKWALLVAAGIGLGLACYHTGATDGANRVQLQWDAAREAAARDAAAARESADRTIVDAVPDELRNDKYNRDRP